MATGTDFTGSIRNEHGRELSNEWGKWDEEESLNSKQVRIGVPADGFLGPKTLQVLDRLDADYMKIGTARYTPDGRLYSPQTPGGYTKEQLIAMGIDNHITHYELRDRKVTVQYATRERAPKHEHVFGVADIVQWVGWVGTASTAVYYFARWLGL